MRPSTRLAAALSLFVCRHRAARRGGPLGFRPHRRRPPGAADRPDPGRTVRIPDASSPAPTAVTPRKTFAPGAYTVAIDAPGFVVSPEARVTLAEPDARLDVRLEPAPIREHVVVAATRGDAALSTLGVSVSVLDREQIAEREPSSLLPAAAGHARASRSRARADRAARPPPSCAAASRASPASSWTACP